MDEVGGENPFEEAQIIFSYTRVQAVADGVLVDVTGTAREAGFKLHTVVSRKVWEECVAVPAGLEGQGQSEAGRLWDVLFMASTAARAARGGDLVTFKVLVLDGLRPDGAPHHTERELWLHIGPGDEAKPVLTIMFPEDY